MGLLPAIQTSAYQLLKLRLLSLLPLAKDAVHVYIGAGCYLVALLLFRLPLGSWRALVPGFLVSLGMEGLDLRDDLRSTGHLHWLASVKDVVNTNLIPLVFVLLARRRLLETTASLAHSRPKR